MENPPTPSSSDVLFEWPLIRLIRLGLALSYWEILARSYPTIPKQMGLAGTQVPYFNSKVSQNGKSDNYSTESDDFVCVSLTAFFRNYFFRKTFAGIKFSVNYTQYFFISNMEFWSVLELLKIFFCFLLFSRTIGQ